EEGRRAGSPRRGAADPRALRRRQRHGGRDGRGLSRRRRDHRRGHDLRLARRPARSEVTMPEVEYTTTMSLPPDAIWAFVKDMNNWAPFLTGYQRHEIQSDTDSVWWLKGDVGILSRTVQLQAHVTEWRGPERVAFTLTGLNEQVEGG